MQQFTVPQFIDVEDKIIGPITARQFVIMMAGFIVIAACYKIFTFNWFLFVGILIFAGTGVFAFMKVNGMPFHFFILNFIQTFKRPFLRVWNNGYTREDRITEEHEEVVPEIPKFTPKLVTTTRLSELSLIVDTQGVYRGEGQNIGNVRSIYERKETGIDDILEINRGNANI